MMHNKSKPLGNEKFTKKVGLVFSNFLKTPWERKVLGTKCWERKEVDPLEGVQCWGHILYSYYTYDKSRDF